MNELNSASSFAILTVDDDPAKRYSIARLLEKAGYRILEASSGGEALEKAQRQPDLIILDVNLPDISGIEVCRRLKSDPVTSHIPVLQFSATYQEAEHRVKGLDAGADAYLPDSVEIPELIATVRALLRAKQAEERARQLADQWQASFDALGDGVALIDMQGVVIRGNQVLRRMLPAADTSELVGRTLHSFLPPPIAAAGGAGLSHPDRLKDRHTAETECDGHWYRCTIDPVPNPQGLAVGAVCVLSDITGRKQAEAKLQFLTDASVELSVLIDVKSTVDAASRLPIPFCADWCVITTASSMILGTAGAGRDRSPEQTAALEEFARLFEVPVEGALQPLRPLLAADANENWLEALCRTPEQLAAARSLSPRSLIVAPLMIRDRVLGLMYLAMAGSGRRHTESDLPFIEDLSQRIAIAIENARLYRDALDADRRKDEFLAMLAHELRNPLAPICNALSILREQEVPAEAGRELHSIIERQVDHLVRLVGDLLDMSRIVRGRIELRIEPVELSKIIEHAVETVRPLMNERGHHLGVTLPSRPIWLEGDLIRLAQVFANLLNNAAKYTNPGGRIDVIAEPGEGGVVIRVRDNGIGIAPDVLPKIFDLFTQLERSIARSEGGLGIGLTLVRNLTEMHGGTVVATSAGQGLGSEFAVHLPTHEPESPPASAPTDRSPVRGLRVVVVEDNFGSASILARLLTAVWEHDVRVAHDGLDALNLMRSFHPHLALVDIGLPGISGYELASRLRQEREFDTTLLVAVTGYGQDEDRRRSQESGFNVHQVKPISVDSLADIFSHPKFVPLWQADLQRTREPEA